MPIEQASFPSPWPISAYRYELNQNDLSTYLVLRQRRAEAPKGRLHLGRLWHRAQPSPVLGYGGFWIILDEGHISTIAVHPDWRGKGLGEMMLVALIETAMLRGAEEVTLEVRVSNQVAQHLYAKYGFAQVGVRKRYYHDNNEDALIMTTPRLHEAVFSDRYAALRNALCDRLSQG
jgi:ribosomal-protein-alanine N-acetyltransferase